MKPKRGAFLIYLFSQYLNLEQLVSVITSNHFMYVISKYLIKIKYIYLKNTVFLNLFIFLIKNYNKYILFC